MWSILTVRETTLQIWADDYSGFHVNTCYFLYQTQPHFDCTFFLQISTFTMWFRKRWLSLFTRHLSKLCYRKFPVSNRTRAVSSPSVTWSSFTVKYNIIFLAQIPTYIMFLVIFVYKPKISIGNKRPLYKNRSWFDTRAATCPEFPHSFCSLFHYFRSSSHYSNTDSFWKPLHIVVFTVQLFLSLNSVPLSFSLFWRIAVPEGDLAAKMRLCSIARGKEFESPGGI